MNIQTFKNNIFRLLHENLDSAVKQISAQSVKHQDKAKQVNLLITEQKKKLIHNVPKGKTAKEKQQALLIIQYCTSVASLEYRHTVWPYEYMALSRRVGELWELFCKAAWDQPSRLNVVRMDAPSFEQVATALRERIQKSIRSSAKPDALADIESLFDLVGEINMKEDEMFLLENVPHIIDFKSGFGSNEKGNTLRLLTVGRAYKLWNPKTKLLLLVRQEQNNNYLNVIQRSGLWDVKCGDEAYAEIDALTGSDINALRSSIIDFKTDLSDRFWNDLSSHLTDLTSYLRW